MRNISKKSLRPISIIPFLLVFLCMFSSTNAQISEDPEKTAIDVEKERPEIERLDNLYSKYLLEGDSVSIAAMYAKDGMMVCARGDEIISKAGGWIRDGIKNDSRHLTFKTVTMNAAGDLLIVTGTAEARSDAGELKYTFRYLVVWKKEDGVWKLYRDFGL